MQVGGDEPYEDRARIRESGYINLRGEVLPWQDAKRLEDYVIYFLEEVKHECNKKP